MRIVVLPTIDARRFQSPFDVGFIKANPRAARVQGAVELRGVRQ
jgi:hypothetical protein